MEPCETLPHVIRYNRPRRRRSRRASPPAVSRLYPFCMHAVPSADLLRAAFLLSACVACGRWARCLSAAVCAPPPPDGLFLSYRTRMRRRGAARGGHDSARNAGQRRFLLSIASRAWGWMPEMSKFQARRARGEGETTPGAARFTRG